MRNADILNAEVAEEAQDTQKDFQQEAFLDFLRLLRGFCVLCVQDVRIQSMESTVSGSGTSPMVWRVMRLWTVSHSQKAWISGRCALRGPTINQ